MVEEEEDSQFIQNFDNFLPDKTASNHRSSYFSRDTEFIKSGLLVLSAAHTTPYSSAIQLVVNEPWLGCVGTGTLGLSLIPQNMFQRLSTLQWTRNLAQKYLRKVFTKYTLVDFTGQSINKLGQQTIIYYSGQYRQNVLNFIGWLSRSVDLSCRKYWHRSLTNASLSQLL